MLFDNKQHSFAIGINRHFFYGWLMLAVGALGLFASGPGQSHIFSVFITPIERDLGISRTALSSAYALATLVASLGLPYVGRLVDRHGVRPVMLVVAVLFAGAAIGFGRVDSLILLTLGFGALRFLGQGSLMLCCSNLVAQWFNRKRGFALSLMSLGFSLSMAAHPPLAQWLIETVGWRQSWFWLGVMTLVLLLPVVVLFVRHKPEDIGLEPDGDTAHPVQGDSPGAAQSALIGLTLPQAIRTGAFWIIALSLSSLSMLLTGMFFHQVSVFDSHGLSPQLATRVFSISAVIMVVCTPVLGRMLDRFPTKPVFACALLSTSFALLSMAFVTDFVGAVAYGVVFGVANATFHAHYAYLWPRFFGRRHLGAIQGAAQTISVVGASLGPLPLGIAYDLFASYAGALLLLSLIPIACALAVAYMRPPTLSHRPTP